MKPCFFAVLALIGLFCSCKTIKATQPAVPTQSTSALITHPLHGIWMLESIKSKNTDTVAVLKGTFLELTTANNYSVYAGCNTFFGNWRHTQDSLIIEPGGGTLMYCEDGGYEQKLTERLFAPHLFKREGEMLTLSCRSGETLVFKRRTATNALIGKKFRVQGLNFKNGVTSSIEQPDQYMTFYHDGRLTGHAGCNRFFADYEIKGEMIAIRDLGTTKMACKSETVHVWEVKLIEHLTSGLMLIEHRQVMKLRDMHGLTLVVLVEME